MTREPTQLPAHGLARGNRRHETTSLLSQSPNVLARALSILWALSTERAAVGLAELSRTTLLNKATLLRYLEVLQDARLVERTGSDYQLGIGAFTLGAAYLSHLDLYKLSRPRMDELAVDLGETISLAVRDGGEVVYVEVVRGQAEIGIQSRIGARQPAHCTALGKTLLAWLTPLERARLIYEAPLTRLTANTITSRDDLEKHLATVRGQGFAIDDQERAEGIRCVAAPIRDHSGTVVAAISVSGAAFRMSGARLDEATHQVVRVTDSISERLGFEGDDVRAVVDGVRT